jgi:hypothetical protein
MAAILSQWFAAINAKSALLFWTINQQAPERHTRESGYPEV